MHNYFTTIWLKYLFMWILNTLTILEKYNILYRL